MDKQSAEFELIKNKCCPLCSAKGVFLIQKYDDRFGQPDLFDFLRCSNCNLVFLKNKIAEESLSDLYGKYYKKNKKTTEETFLKKILKMIYLDKIILNDLAGNLILLKKVIKNKSVLEIGPGYNCEIKNLVKEKNLKWHGLEVDKELVDLLQEDELTAFHNSLDNYSKIAKIKYDYILLSQSIEHQHDLDDFFLNVKKLLNENGKIIFTTPNFNSRFLEKYKEKWINWHAPYHNYILSKQAIDNICDEYGFEISKYYTYTPTSWYFLQKNFTLPKRGEKNDKFNFNFSLVKQFLVSIYLRIRELFKKNDGDCIYCELKIKNIKNV
jgi:SAM-dependent methyltransferase